MVRASLMAISALAVTSAAAAADVPPPLEPPTPAEPVPVPPPAPAPGAEDPASVVRPPGELLIAIDPGHGGADPGAIGTLPPGTRTLLPRRRDGRGLFEKDVNLDVSRRLSRWLQVRGYRTIMTRTRDAGAGDLPYRSEGVDLARRVRIANRARADLFISVHANASVVGGQRGTETYHFYVASPQGRDLARSVQERMIARIGLPNRGVRRAGFYVLRETTMPAVLVETAFVDHPEDAQLLARPRVRAEISRAIGEGIERYRLAGARYEPPDSEQSAGEPLRIRYWVHAGIFRRKMAAQQRLAALREKGFDVVLRRRYARRFDRPAYFVVAGQFIFLDNAKRRRAQLRAARLPGIITSATVAARR